MSTPTNLDQITTALANTYALIAEITANPQPNYSVQGVSVSWADYLRMLTDQAMQMQELLIVLSGPYELVSVGVS